MFVIGGLSGIFMASTPVDIFIHDTYFIVGHIHYVLFGGSLFGAFAGLYYWYPKMFGRMMSERWGKIHWFLTFVTFNCVFFPMHFLGMRGMQRRIYDYTQYTHLQGPAADEPVHDDLALRAGRWRRSSSCFNFFLSHAARASSRARTPGTRTRSSGRPPRRPRTRTSPAASRPSTAAPTSTACRATARTSCPQNEPGGPAPARSHA